MVQGIDDPCHVIEHISLNIVFTAEQFRRAVCKVRGYELSEHSLLIVLIELLDAFGEETECCAYKHASCTAGFDLLAYIKHGTAGCDHIVDDDAILALDRITEELMCYDRVFPVHDLGVITALVEHTHVGTENIGEIYRTVRCAFVRADDHEVILIKFQIRNRFEQSFQELICRHEIIKAHQRNCIADTGIMCVKCDNIRYAVIRQFL